MAEAVLRLAADDPDRAERERRAIIRAAHRLIGREGRAATPLEDILRGAGVNRRTFYRHFPSKDALVLTMQREAAAGVRDSLRAVVREAGDARAAAVAWIEELLAIGWDERASRDGRTFMTPEVGLVVGIADALEDIYAEHRGILAEVLAAGRTDGSLPAAQPEWDALAIHAVVVRYLEMRARGRLDRPYAAVVDDVVRRFLPPSPEAAGLTGTPG
ncbi:TetR/AcrR family transcriptional regulator [Frankia sp. AvcI1]|uniref:TetR/AcrR family transcriptional regulator n=1 Tax=Frankia sp. AvcI1 TaxID=573496 RepID=UPI0021191666|nr:TetR/AcrR family transcriptional regulator [Frankia sp. AvcI1]